VAGGEKSAARDAAVVITGVGAITALGATLPATWENVVAGKRSFAPVSLFPADDYRVRLVAEVQGLPAEGSGDYSRTSELALRAAREALASAELPRGDRRVGLVLGGTTAGMLQTESTLAVLLSPEGAVDPAAREEALRRMLSHPLSAPSDRLARELGPFTRVRSLSSACSGGANAIMVGATWLELGLADVVLCGAADALCRVTLSGFNALGALDPEGARPFDRSRRGLTLGEGAGFVVLERAVDASARGKAAICTVLGWAARAEAHHITNPEPNGLAPSRAMEAALARAGLAPSGIDYVNAHGTGTPLNDPMETRALARVFREELGRVAVSSQKGQFGHTLAAAGAIEAAITATAIANGIVPPTGGLEDPDPQCGLLHVKQAERREIRAALSSSFGFGGMDTVLVLGRPEMRPRQGARAPKRVVVTGAAALTPGGVFDARNVDALLATTEQAGEAIPFDLGDFLDLDRARRLDRASRLAAIACGMALGTRAEDGRTGVASEKNKDAAVVLGNAFGSVDGTATFMRRLREKGARLASPADFPSLVPSSPAGYVSIYLGLAGPTLVVADLGTSGEAAFTQAHELISAGEVDRVVVGAVEEKSTIVDEVFRVVFGPDRRGEPRTRPPRREGAGAVALAAEDVALANGDAVLAVVDQVLAWSDDARVVRELAPPGPDGLVVLGGKSAAVDALLAESSWSSCKRVSCGEHSGSHEAAGAIALAVAAGVLAREGGPAATLCVGSARGWGYAITLRKWRG